MSFQQEIARKATFWYVTDLAWTAQIGSISVTTMIAPTPLSAAQQPRPTWHHVTSQHVATSWMIVVADDNVIVAESMLLSMSVSVSPHISRPTDGNARIVAQSSWGSVKDENSPFISASWK